MGVFIARFISLPKTVYILMIIIGVALLIFADATLVKNNQISKLQLLFSHVVTTACFASIMYAFIAWMLKVN